MSHAAAVVVTIEERYRAEFLKYLGAPEETALLGGYELGRAALSEGFGVLEIATLHCEALNEALNRNLGSRERTRILAAQSAFFMEVLSPFEMAHRGFCDSNAMLHRLNDMLEAQARRIAYSLHSEAGQLLSSLHFSLAEAARGIPPENARHLKRVRQTLLEIEDRLRNLSHDLHPTILDLGLASALELLAESIAHRWGLPVTVRVALGSELPPSIANTIYRIAQEALTNAAKHADAKHAEVEVRQFDHKLLCSVRDDGTGFDNTAGFRKRRPGLGLTEIKERVLALGGSVRLGLNGECGTDLTIEIPVDV